GIQLLRLAFPDRVPYYLPLGIDGATLAFAAAASMITGIIFGIVPALRTTRASVEALLRDGARGSASAARSRLRSTLVVAELALSIMLMIGAGLLIKSYRSLEGTRLG